MNSVPNLDSSNNTTLVFLVKKRHGEIDKICLAYKKRGFGQKRWNGVGGKLKNDTETIEDAAKREAKEEIGIIINILNKVAKLNFTFLHHPSWNQLVHVYLCYSWEGEPTETEEMRPQWFRIANIPFRNMWPDDIYWLPMVLNGHLITAHFEFAPGDIIVNYSVKKIDKL